MSWFYCDAGWSLVFGAVAFMALAGHPIDPAHIRKRWLYLVILAALVPATIPISRSSARDLEGRFANSPLHDWFNQLKSGKGLCCSFADGASVEDPDWTIKDGHYRVRLDANWYDVPDDAVIGEPNRAGKTMVWPYYSDGKLIYIRCFMPGDMG